MWDPARSNSADDATIRVIMRPAVVTPGYWTGIARKRLTRSSNGMSVATLTPLAMTISIRLEPFVSVFGRTTAMASIFMITGW